MNTYYTKPIEKTERIPKLVADLYAKMPEIEAARAELITESYMETEGQPIMMRRAKAFAHILENIPIIIRPGELIVGSSTIAPRGCQTYPEFSYEWMEAEFDTVEHRAADPFYISDETKKDSRRRIVIGKERRPANWHTVIWPRRRIARWNIIFLHREITSITV